MRSRKLRLRRNGILLSSAKPVRQYSERTTAKGLLKRFSENAGAVGLTLGIVLSASAIYDVFWRKPAADRLDAINRFNQVVNSAAKTRQEIIQAQQSGDAALRLSVAAMATPRILNDISTAKALLPLLNESDVHIPQLIVLINESMVAGDNFSAGEFVRRAVSKKDATSYMAAEALRYEGKYLFITGKHDLARESYIKATNLLGNNISSHFARGYNIVDLIGMQYAFGLCEHIEFDIERLRDIVWSQGISVDARKQLVDSALSQVNQYYGQKCGAPKNLAKLSG